MIEFFFTFLILLLIVAAMAVGVMRGRPPISGSCGGLNRLGIDTECEICGGDPNKCEVEQQEGRRAARTPFYDAS